jgi:hypothetical protein
MHMPTHTDLLGLWETGRTMHPLDQGVLAVEAGFPESADRIADWPMGRRNRALAQLRCRWFGGAARGWTTCPQCAEKLEFALDVRALAETGEQELQAAVEVRGRRFRLPTSRDLAALVHETDASNAARLLLGRIGDGNSQEVREGDLSEGDMSEGDMAAVEEQLAAADPLAEVRLSFDCPNCEAQFEESVDLPTFLWAELEAYVRRLLVDVHRLASAYGWSEAEILGMSAARRELYLDMVTA